MPRLIQKLSSPKKAVQPAKPNGSAFPVKYALNALNMPLRMMSASVSGADCPSEKDAGLSDVQRNFALACALTVVITAQ